MTEAIVSIVKAILYGALFLFVWSTFVTPQITSADAASVQALVEEAKSNPEASAVVAEALKLHPQPTRAALARVREDMNDVQLTVAARQATGDFTLLTKAETARRLAAKEEAERLRISKLTWTTDEKYRSLLQFVGPVAVILGFLVVAMFGYRRMAYGY
jgi:hypothetical protein